MYISCHFFAILVVFGQRVESDIGGSIECGRRFREGSKPRVTHFDHDSPASSRRKRVCLCRPMCPTPPPQGPGPGPGPNHMGWGSGDNGNVGIRGHM